MITIGWSKEELEAARREGDPEVDRLVEKLLDSGGDFSNVGRLGYNRLLDIADKLVEAPELALVRSSAVAGQMRSHPRELVDYFDPIEAPPWVDQDKLSKAGGLWEQNMLAILGALYCASLPYCYLMEKGIPVLYETARLKEERYIYQRMYETGLFLGAVMSPGGLRIISDIDVDSDDHTLDILNKLDPGGAWYLDGGRLKRRNESGSAVDPLMVSNEARQSRPSAKRYIWGKGLISAKKVRFLHASMRFMLTRPDRVKPFGPRNESAGVAESLGQLESPWDESKLGKPVNQEDLAYTLLTFGYVIPAALRKWGLRWTLAEREAYLHLWKVVGYAMGLKDELLTDNWDEAESLFNKIHEHQAKASRQAKELTDSLIRLLQDYLPPILGLDRALPRLLIRHQLGSTNSDMIISDKWMKGSPRLFATFIFYAGLATFRAYFLVRGILFRLSPTFAAFMGGVFSHAGGEFVESWRSSYRRRPFYVPIDANTWERIPGADEGFTERLRAWRRKVFYTMSAGIGLLVGSTLLFFAILVLFASGSQDILMPWLWIAVGGFASALILLKAGLSWVGGMRPKVVEEA